MRCARQSQPVHCVGLRNPTGTHRLRDDLSPRSEVIGTLDMTLLLKNALPELADELAQLLLAAGQRSLADQVPGLNIVDRCRCGDDFCASFYTLPKPDGSYGAGLDFIDLDAEDGMIILDVVDG